MQPLAARRGKGRYAVPIPLPVYSWTTSTWGRRAQPRPLYRTEHAASIEQQLQFLRALRDHEEVVREEDRHQSALLCDECDGTSSRFDGESTFKRQRLVSEAYLCERDARIMLIR